MRSISSDLGALILGAVDGNADFIFGLPGNAVPSRKAEGLMKNARGHLALRRSLAAQGLGPAVAAVRLLYGEFEYAAKSWPQAFRGALKDEVNVPVGANSFAQSGACVRKNSHLRAMRNALKCRTILYQLRLLGVASRVIMSPFVAGPCFVPAN